MADDATTDSNDSSSLAESSNLRGGGAKPWPPAWLPPIAVLLVVLVWPLIGWGAIKAWQSAQNRIEDWLPASYPETRSLFWFFDRFGSDEFLMISWDGASLDDPRLQQLEQQLVAAAPDGIQYFAKADSGRTVVDRLMQQHRFSQAEAKARLYGLFVGPEGNQSCVIALVSPAGFADRKAALQWAWQAAQETTGLPADAIHLAGTTADSIAVDEASSENLLELNLISALICFLILWCSLRNFWLVGTIFLCAMLNQHLALALIYSSGGHIDSVQLLVANLCFVLSLSAGLHYLGYFRKSAATGVQSPALDAIRHAWLPTLLAVGTTSLGFVSLCTSELTPIRSFGLYAAILVPINALIVVGLLAIHATWTSRGLIKPRSERKSSGVTAGRPPLDEPYATSDQPLQVNASVWSWFLLTLGRRPLTLFVVWMVVMTGLGLGSRHLLSSVGTRNLLSPDSKLIRDYQWLEDEIGPLVPIELVLRFPADNSLSSREMFQRLLAIDELRRRLSAVDEITSTMSVLNFIPTLPRGGSMEDIAKRTAIGRVANSSKRDLIDARLLYEDEQEQCWRLSGRVAASQTDGYEQILDRLQQVVDDYLASPRYASLQIDISGGVPFLYRTQQQLLADLLHSFSTAFVMIAVTMALLLRSLIAGLLLMIPNVTPAAVVFGLMGWLGIEVELGTVLTASVMMGVCVDDTLHLLSHFRELRHQGLSPAEAVAGALRACGGAMLQTALVCGVGMLVFAFSPFTPVSRFAWLTFALLSIGAISDLILTPAILLSPLHRFFYREPAPAQVRISPKIAITGEQL